MLSFIDYIVMHNTDSLKIRYKSSEITEKKIYGKNVIIHICIVNTRHCNYLNEKQSVWFFYI